jgi:hypothetical protein
MAGTQNEIPILVKLDSSAVELTVNVGETYSPVAIKSLSGIDVSTAINTTGLKSVEIQADLISNPSARVYIIVGATCTVATAIGYITNGGTIKLNLNGTTNTAVSALLTDSAGEIIEGGVSDYLRCIGGA